MTKQTNEALELAKRYIEALTQKDPDAIIAILHDKIVMEEANPIVKGEDLPGSKTCRGEAVRAFLREVPKLLARVQFTNVVWRTTNDGLAIFEAVGDMRLTDGRPYSNKYLMIFEVSEGKLIRVKEFLNPLVWARACGLPLESLP